MKKFTLLASMLCAAVSFNAQEKLTFEDFSKFGNLDNSFLNHSNSTVSNYANLLGSPSAKSADEATSTLTNKRWGQFRNINDNQLQTFELNYSFGAAANISLKLLNDNLAETKAINFDIPTTTNDVQIITKATKNIGANDGKLKFGIYAHYFEGGDGA